MNVHQGVCLAAYPENFRYPGADSVGQALPGEEFTVANYSLRQIRFSKWDQFILFVAMVNQSENTLEYVRT
jgi:hypothetical protein